jgi:hypothetical protein
LSFLIPFPTCLAVFVSRFFVLRPQVTAVIDPPGSALLGYFQSGGRTMTAEPGLFSNQFERLFRDAIHIRYVMSSCSRAY